MGVVRELSSRSALPRALRCLLVCGLLLLGGTGFNCLAQTPASAAEYQVKAAFLFKFLGFVEWPAQAHERTDSPLLIGVMGADALSEALGAVVANRAMNGRAVHVRRLRPGDSLAGVHLLFLGRDENVRASDLIGAAKGRPLLMVTESDTAFAGGSAINFVLEDNKVRFDVALRPVEQANLKISSRLLAVARRVVAAS
jgi:hypothetical protein